MLLRCDHVHLITPDLEGTVQWYCRVLGARVTFQGHYKGSPDRYLELAGMIFILFSRLDNEPEPAPSRPSPRRGVDHFGFRPRKDEPA